MRNVLLNHASVFAASLAAVAGSALANDGSPLAELVADSDLVFRGTVQQPRVFEILPIWLTAKPGISIILARIGEQSAVSAPGRPAEGSRQLWSNRRERLTARREPTSALRLSVARESPRAGGYRKRLITSFMMHCQSRPAFDSALWTVCEILRDGYSASP